MKTLKKHTQLFLGAAVLFGAASVRADSQSHYDDLLRAYFDAGVRYSTKVEFPNRVGALGDPTLGRGNFGLAADGVSPDPTTALFEGHSAVAGDVTSNGRTCQTCHRGEHNLGLPPLPLTSTVPLNDVLFTGLPADIGDDPLGFVNFDSLGLLFHRPLRFNPLYAPDHPLRQAFFWRKTPRLLNIVFTFGNLTDGRARELVETSRGAVFTHTQNGDLRFDDLADRERLRNMSAFMEEQIDPPELQALLEPGDPLYQTLVDDPFYTVHPTTPAEQRGQKVFERYCFSCHNMPNVFSNRDHVDGLPLSFSPHYGHPMDVGVSQRNAHNLEFRRYDAATDTRVPIIVPLAAEDGRTVQVTIVDDIGVAAATGRYEDLHRFKVPQLRRISELGPYFHDNSAATLEEVVDFFNSDWYNDSADGRKAPIHLSPRQKADLVAFLEIL